MTPTDAARILFEEGWNQRDFAEVRRILAGEILLHVGGTARITTIADLESIVARWHAAFPDFRFVVHSITADDHTAAVRATLNGTHLGPWGGLEATGRRISVEHAFFLRFDEGLIVEVWEFLDQPTLDAQLAGDQGTHRP